MSPLAQHALHKTSLLLVTTSLVDTTFTMFVIRCKVTRQCAQGRRQVSPKSAPSRAMPQQSHPGSPQGAHSDRHVSSVRARFAPGSRQVAPKWPRVGCPGAVKITGNRRKSGKSSKKRVLGEKWPKWRKRGPQSPGARAFLPGSFFSRKCPKSIFRGLASGGVPDSARC